jgi:EAL domain-containing protein (putative c-di-GMP-specific phosphodiesterase class I)
VGFEALVRWAHPERGIVAPSEFVPLAEHGPLIVQIDDHVRDEACSTVGRWNAGTERGGRYFVSVNLSGRDITPALPSRVSRSLEGSGLEPTDLVVEITETIVVADTKDNVAVLNELKSMGLRIALDDFGTGYSSLGYLRHFPIDVIKLDKSFTDELPDGERGLRLVQAVGRLAADLGALAEAEGVETKAQVDCLGSNGWNLAQGHYFSAAVDATAIPAMLAPRHGAEP